MNLPHSVNVPATLSVLLADIARKTPDAIALLAPGHQPLSYSQLDRQIAEIGTMLRCWGISRTDRVALVLPNGATMAVAFLAIAAHATCAPLNPAYGDREFNFYLSDLQPKALIIAADLDSPAREVAKRLGIAIVELSPIPGAPAGIFTLTGTEIDAPPPNTVAKPTDIALVLHTSGTTSRPKLVPLTQQNLCSSAQHIRTTLALTAADRALNVMPLFHIHGLVGVLLSSLSGGSSIICTPGFSGADFFDWIATFSPTWYSAVPTIHQQVLARAAANLEIVRQHPLRFIRSSSASLPAPVMSSLEETFNTPTIEAYGMTEAAHQMASNPLPPGSRKAGSVGVPVGSEMTILDRFGAELAIGQVGEVCIRGDNVTSGYEQNPTANATAFINGWFRTGDLGYFDPDGYLFLRGRIKEIINRGGEKISPQEVDEVLMEHPAIAQVVTFAAPHTLLGEEVGVAIVLKPQATTTELAIKQFVAERLADFKVPRVVVFVQEIPKGATGKLQRIGLAEKLSLQATDPKLPRADFIAPQTSIEISLARIWAEVLGVESIGMADNFFQLGGESLAAAQIINRIRSIWQVELPLMIFFGRATLAEMAIEITQLQAAQIDDETLAQMLADLEST
ncbi:AMP-binding protein [Chamaesiphon sp. VAR_48_metabat_135_sub]|uniref:AMP-binding protein n=1 Tax=Chamaesiphon sp. VAR_48_metabat_135_sub TaxID=2964699 RepID=UPI00286CEC8F|nr:AMP-binding protein [Chamaesiphon sp. VAR_48_metabat_135_sub]